MKKQYMILVLAALSVISCQKNDFETVYAGGDSIVRFAPSMAEVSYADGLTKSAAASADQSGLSLSAADGSFSLPMFHETVEGIVKGTFTKGELYNETTGDVSLGKYVDDFMVAAWNTPEGDTSVKVIPDDKVMTSESYVTNGYQKVMKRTGANGGEYWMTVQGQLDDFKSTLPDADDEYIWKSGETKTFYAYANLPRSGASMQVDGSGQTLTYTVQATAAAQTDILLGSYTGNGGDKGTAEIHFGHPLTAVCFKQGDMPGVTGIRSISLSGLASGGTVAMDADGKIGDWTVAGTEEYKTEATLSGGESTLAVDETTKLIGVDSEGNYNGAFLLVPQTLSDHKVTVTAVLTTADGDVTVYADINTGTWQAGYTNTYTLGYSSSDPDLLPGKFSISATKYVQFSGGNLRYTVASSKWSFFDEQYECGPSSYSSGHDKEISLFTWGYDAAKSIIPDGASTDNVSRTSGDLSLSEDWGYVFGGASSPWRTLTIAEWKYLFNTRTDAASKVGYATVGGVKGIIILPDTFTDPMKNGGSGAFKPKSTTGYSANVYTSGGNWEAMEAAGAVFLPAASYRNGSKLDSNRVDWLYYWSSSAEDGSEAFGVSFSSTSPYLDYSYNRSFGCSVRLVQDFPKPEIEPTFVDLGLPSGLLWANVNIGAVTETGPGSIGDYYFWGETVPWFKTQFVSSSSMLITDWLEGHRPTTSDNATSNVYQQYANMYDRSKSGEDGYIASDLTGVYAKYDAVIAKGWEGRMPTSAEWEELWTKTTVTRSVTVDGITCYRFVNKNDSKKYILLPTAGRYDKSYSYDGSDHIYQLNAENQYWSSTSCSDKTMSLCFSGRSNAEANFEYERFKVALPIRAVKEKPTYPGWADLGIKSDNGKQLLWCKYDVIGIDANGIATLASDNDSYHSTMFTWAQASSIGGIASMPEGVSGTVRLPSYNEIGALKDASTSSSFKWINTDIKGGKITLMGQVVFFPANGYYTDSLIQQQGTSARYWCGTEETHGQLLINSFGVGHNTKVTDTNGLSVRLVIEVSPAD